MDAFPPIAPSGTFAKTPWPAIVGHMAKRALTGRVDIDLGSVFHAVHFEKGSPTALLSGDLVADQPVPVETLADAIVALAKLPGTAKYALVEGPKAIAREAGTPARACDPLVIVVRALAAAPPALAEQQAKAAFAAVGGRALAVRKPIEAGAALATDAAEAAEAAALAKRIGERGATVAALLEGASGADRAKRAIALHGLLLIGAVEVAGGAGGAAAAGAGAGAAPARTARKVAPESAPKLAGRNPGGEAAGKTGARAAPAPTTAPNDPKAKPQAPPRPPPPPAPKPHAPAPQPAKHPATPAARARIVPAAPPAPIVVAKAEPGPAAAAAAADSDSDAAVDVVVTLPPPVAALVNAQATQRDVEFLVAPTSAEPSPHGGAARVEADGLDADGLDAQSHYERAYRLLSSGANDQAAAALAKALALDATHPDSAALAIWLDVQRTKDADTAALEGFLTKLDALVRRAPRCERAFFYRGSLHRRLGRTAKATADFEMATELNPRSVSLARGLQLAKSADEGPAEKAEKAEKAERAERAAASAAVAPERFGPPVGRAAARRRRVVVLAALVLVLGGVAVYLLAPPPPPPAADFSWVPTAGPPPPP